MNIFITDLQAYNEGYLIGKWISLPLTDFKLAQAMSEVLKEGEHLSGSENHEEFFITDFECSYLEIEEFHDIYKLNEMAQMMEELDGTERKKIEFLLDETRCTIEEAIERMEDCEIYENVSYEDLAYQFIEDGLFGTIPESISAYIDYEKIGRDLSYDYTEYNGDIFRCD